MTTPYTEATERVKLHVGDGIHGALGVTYIVFEDTDVTDNDELHDTEHEVAVCYDRNTGKVRGARIVNSWNDYDRLRAIEEVAGEMAEMLGYIEGTCEDRISARDMMEVRDALSKYRALLNTEEQK